MTTETQYNNIKEAAEVENARTQAEKPEVNQEIKHETTIFAEPIFHLGQFTVTNSLINSWAAALILVIAAVAIRKKISGVPRGIQNYLEIFFEGALNLADSVTGSREKSIKFLPLVLPLFLFILLNNWLGLLPGVGSIGLVESAHGEKVFIPLFRGATADLNTTLALAIMAVILTHVAGVFAAGAWSHLNRFVNIKALLIIPKKIFKDKEYTAILVQPINFFVGLIELVGELAKVASLSFRLFGNIFAGEVLLGALAAIFAYLLPLPFIFLEIIVGLIQALIFSTLTLVFLTIMTTGHGEGEDHQEAH